MQCPKCKDCLLEKKSTTTGVELDSCRRCGSVWLDRGEIFLQIPSKQIPSFNKAIEKGATFTHQTVTKEQITYLEKLDVLLEEFRAVKLPIINIDHYLKQTEFYLNKAQKQFTKKSINSGNIAMTNLDYRKAYYHYEDALTYNSIDASIKTQKEIAFNHAKKEIVLAPFFNETPSINDQFKNLFQAILLKESLPEKVYKSQILIKGEDFLAKIHKETILMLNKKKSLKIYVMRNLYSVELMKKKGLNYYSIGRQFKFQI